MATYGKITSGGRGGTCTSGRLETLSGKAVPPCAFAQIGLTKFCQSKKGTACAVPLGYQWEFCIAALEALRHPKATLSYLLLP